MIDKDVVRDLLPDSLGGLSYEAMLALAERQLELGLSVVADSPLGYGTAYARAMAIGTRTKANLLVVECECSDPSEWRRRIESRAGTGLAAHHATDWQKIEAFYARTSADPFVVTVPMLRLDTALPLVESVDRVSAWLGGARRAG